MNFNIYIEGFIGQGDFFSEGFSLKSLREQVNGAPDGTDELTIHINSGGGSVTEGFAIHDFLVTSKYKVNTVVEGMCGSIATIIAQSATNGGKRSMHKNSEYFIHNPYWQPQSPTPMEAAQLESLAEDLKKAEERILNFYNEVTGQDVAFLKEKMKAQTSFTSEEAKQYGFVDEIIGQEVIALTKYRLVAFIEPKHKNNQQMDIQKMFSDFEANVLNKISAMIKPVIKNDMATAVDGTVLYYEQLAEVFAVYTDEAMTTPVPDGTYEIGTNKYTVVGGVITTIEAVAAANTDEAVKAENEALKAKVAELEASISAKAVEVETIKAEKETALATATEVATEFTNFKSQFVTGTGELKPEFQSFRGEGQEPKKTMAQQVLELRNKK